MHDFLIFKTFISPTMLLIFYYIGAIIMLIPPAPAPISICPKLISKILEMMASASPYSGLKSPIPNEYNIGQVLNNVVINFH